MIVPAIAKAPRDVRDADLIDGTASLLGESTHAPVNYVRMHFASIIDHAKTDKEKILVTEHKRPAAAVVPVGEFRILKLLDQIGVTSDLSQLTYKDINIEDAIKELTRIIKNGIKQHSGGGKDGDTGSLSSSAPS
jgi:antitoxin (DNA-binding transcriptional repressor) of toxin-antitoxin stability system